ncbi:MAG: orotate phosphoribosyltransferase [Candidatus Altiarchaeota archaeon]
MICDICGKTVDKVYVCSDCGSLFCVKCGNVEKKLCKDCKSLEF